MSTPREIAEDITEKGIEHQNLDTENIVILKATLASLKNTKEAFRDGNWQRKFNKVTKDIDALTNQDKNN